MTPENLDVLSKWALDLETRREDRELLSSAQKEVAIAFGLAKIGGSPVAGGEMGKMLGELIQDHEQRIWFSSITEENKRLKNAE